MRTYYHQDAVQHPIHPPNSNGLEARVRELEVHARYGSQERDRLGRGLSEAHDRITDLENTLEREVRRAGLWLISVLLTAVCALAFTLFKLLFPGIIGS